MNRGVGRRQLLATGAGATLAGVAGCLSISGGDSKFPVELSLVNDTSESMEVWIQLSGVRDDTGATVTEEAYVGRGYSAVLQVDLPPAEYALRVLVDDAEPAVDSLESEVRWTVTEDDCSHRSWAVFTESDGEFHLSLIAQSCSTSEIHDGEQE